MAEWSNWAGTVRVHPTETVMVRDTEQLQRLCEECSLSLIHI